MKLPVRAQPRCGRKYSERVDAAARLMNASGSGFGDNLDYFYFSAFSLRSVEDEKLFDYEREYTRTIWFVLGLKSIDKCSLDNYLKSRTVRSAKKSRDDFYGNMLGVPYKDVPRELRSLINFFYLVYGDLCVRVPIRLPKGLHGLKDAKMFIDEVESKCNFVW